MERLLFLLSENNTTTSQPTTTIEPGNIYIVLQDVFDTTDGNFSKTLKTIKFDLSTAVNFCLQILY